MRKENSLLDRTEIEGFEVEYSSGAHPDDKEAACFRIDSGPYSGFVISFNYIRPTVDEGKDTMTLSFDYDVLSLAGDFTEEIVKAEHSAQLNATVANVAMSLFKEFVENTTKQKLDSKEDKE